MTALVSLLFIAMIPIDCKITNFSLYLYIAVSPEITFMLVTYLADGEKSQILSILAA